MKDEKEIRDELREVLLQIFEEEFDNVSKEFSDEGSELSARRRELMFMALAGEDNPYSGTTHDIK